VSGAGSHREYCRIPGCGYDQPCGGLCGTPPACGPVQVLCACTAE
jgi:hypothetical protein